MDPTITVSSPTDRSPGVARTVSGVRTLILQYEQGPPPENLAVTKSSLPRSRTRSSSPKSQPRRFGTVTESKVRFLEKDGKCPYQHEETINVLQEKIKRLQRENQSLLNTVQTQKEEIARLKAGNYGSSDGGHKLVTSSPSKIMSQKAVSGTQGVTFQEDTTAKQNVCFFFSKSLFLFFF